jgi:hypothetical protein
MGNWMIADSARDRKAHRRFSLMGADQTGGHFKSFSRVSFACQQFFEVK